MVFSGTKGLVAICLAMLVDRGQLDPDAPVCRYWPEFAEAGKERVLVNEIASHQARLPGIRTKLVLEDILDDDRMAALLAAQPQEGDPRAADVYHALTYGWLCGELIRRVDGRSVGRFFAEEVAEPLISRSGSACRPASRSASRRCATRMTGAPAGSTTNSLPPTNCSLESGTTRRCSRPTICHGTHAPFTPPRSREAAELGPPDRSPDFTAA